MCGWGSGYGQDWVGGGGGWSDLGMLGGAGPQGPAEHLVEHVGQQAEGDEQDDAEPGRPAGQHLHEHVVHPLVVPEGPGRRGGSDEEGR